MLPFHSNPLHLFCPSWRAGRRLAPFFLPFAPSPTDNREWNLEILDPIAGPCRHFPERLSLNLHRLLIEVGIAQTLATTSWDPRSWYALYRYGSDFAGTAPDLRFYSGVVQKDPRLTAVASEEIATGITCYLLRDYFDLPHIADTFACIQKTELRYIDSVSEKRPDYFCQGRDGQSVLVESKGSTGTRSTITPRIDPEGWGQVQNVVPTNHPLRDECGRMVIGTHFCVEGKHPRSETTTIIKDPEGPESLEENPESDMTLRLAYAKCLRFMGQDAVAERLISRAPMESLQYMLKLVREIDGIPFLPLGQTPFGDAIGLFEPTAKALFLNPGESIMGDISESLYYLKKIRESLRSTGYALPNGVIVIHDLDRVEE